MDKKNTAGTREEWVIILCLTFLGLIIRFFWVSHPAPWIDEIFSINYARNDVSHLLSLTRDTDIHPPFYYLFLKSVSTLLSEDRAVLRGLSVVFGGLSVPVIYLLARDRLGSKAALFSALFFCLLPVNIHYSREMRTYATLAFFLLVATYFFIKVIYAKNDQPQLWRNAIFFALALTITFHLHYSASIYFVLFAVAALISFWFDRNRERLFFLGGALFGAAVLCLPQSFHFINYSTSVVEQDFWIAPTTFRVFYSISLGAYPFPSWTKAIAGLAYLTGAVILFRRDPRFAMIALVFITLGPLLTAVIGIFKPVYLVRTIQAFTVLSPILLGAAIAAIPRLWATVAATAVLTIIHIAALPRDYPATRQFLFAESLYDTLSDDTNKVIFYQAHLQDQFEMLRLPWKNWRAVGLAEFGKTAEIDQQISRCRTQDKCEQVILIMERAPRFLIAEGQFWMAKLDVLAVEHGVQDDVDAAGYRILALSLDGP